MVVGVTITFAVLGGFVPELAVQTNGPVPEELKFTLSPKQIVVLVGVIVKAGVVVKDTVVIPLLKILPLPVPLPVPEVAPLKVYVTDGAGLPPIVVL